MFFAEDELKEAARQVGFGYTFRLIQRRHEASNAWDEGMFMADAAAIGRRNYGQKILDKAKANRENPAGDTKVTMQELHDHCVRAGSRYIYDTNLESVFADIIAHREVLEDGAVYKTTSGGFYRWDAGTQRFKVFGNAQTLASAAVTRPLTKVS